MGRCDAKNETKIVTVWDKRYCTDAAYTNSTSKQAEVMRLAEAEALVATLARPFDE